MDPKSEQEFDRQAGGMLDVVCYILVGLLVFGLVLWFCGWMSSL